MFRDDFARIVVEHMNETRPEYLSAMVKDNPKSLKQFVDARVREAMLLNKQYNETTSLYLTRASLCLFGSSRRFARRNRERIKPSRDQSDFKVAE
ncbi:MAG: hypothetical protein H6Q12_622 [Bacteroidetes bacterium]|nr:hypothetical protein [Bacteroidota bacterium]